MSACVHCAHTYDQHQPHRPQNVAAQAAGITRGCWWTALTGVVMVNALGEVKGATPCECPGYQAPQDITVAASDSGVFIGRAEPLTAISLTWSEANALQAELRRALTARGVTMRDAL